MIHTRTVVAATALCLAATLGLTGCATESDYTLATAERLQERVLGATTAAASADYATVLSALDALEVDLGDALARGQVTQARHDAIAAAIAHVRKDVEATIAAKQPEPAPQPEPQPRSEETGPKPEGPAKGPDNKGGPSNNGKGKG